MEVLVHGYSRLDKPVDIASCSSLPQKVVPCS